MYKMMWKRFVVREVFMIMDWSSNYIESLVFSQVFPCPPSANITCLMCFQTPVPYLTYFSQVVDSHFPRTLIILAVTLSSLEILHADVISKSGRAPWLPSSRRPSLACLSLFISQIISLKSLGVVCAPWLGTWNHSPRIYFDLCDSSLMKLCRKFFGQNFLCIFQ